MGTCSSAAEINTKELLNSSQRRGIHNVLRPGNNDPATSRFEQLFSFNVIVVIAQDLLKHVKQLS